MAQNNQGELLDISKIEYVNLSDLVPDTANARKHSDRNVEEVARSIREFGQHAPLVVQEGTNRILVGNCRYEAMMSLGWEKAAVYYVNDDNIQAVRRSLADNRTAELAEWDDDILKTLLEGLGPDDLDVPGWSDEELEAMLGITDFSDGNAQEDDVPEPPAEPTSKPGDLWVLGKHKLLCGDSTKSENIVRLMGDLKADMVLTDPPYGVDYTGGTKDALKIQNDTRDEVALAELIKRAFDVAQEISRPGAYWYATVPPGPLHLIFADDWKSRGILRQILVWVKDSLVLGHSEYHYKHEPILFGWIPGERYKNPDRTRTSVWEFPRPKRSEEHPTMKPVALWAQAIKDGSKPGNLIYDPFLGSGTTIIAAEQLNRICYGVEIDPKYCDVIVKRWEDYTGEKAQLETV